MKTAVVTGASGGIGSKISVCLAEKGYNVVLCYCITFIIASFFYFRGRYNHLFLFILLLLIIFQILIKASRGALLCMGLSMSVFLYKGQKMKLMPRVWFYMMFGFAIILIYLAKNLILEQILGFVSEKQSSQKQAEHGLEDEKQTKPRNVAFENIVAIKCGNLVYHI